MYIFNIGIDLSTTQTGVAVTRQFIGGEKKLMESFTITFPKSPVFHIGLIYPYMEDIVVKSILSLERYIIQCQKNETNYDINIGIEVANFKNAKLTNKFNLYAGILSAIFHTYINKMQLPYGQVNFKLFNSNQWQKWVGCEITDKREVRKAKAKEFALKNFSDLRSNLSEDEYDAICIAYFLRELKSTEEIGEAVKIAQKKHQNIQKARQRITNKINTKLNQLVSLDSKKNSKRIETLKKQIEELKIEENKLKGWVKYEQ